MDPRIPGSIIVLTVLEAIVLRLYHRRTGKGLPPRGFLFNLLSGAGLLLAWLCAALGLPWPCIAGCLAAALAAHGADLWGRAR